MQQLYPNNLKNWEFGKESPQNFHSERMTIAERQGMSEDENSEEKPTQPKTNFSSCLGIHDIEGIDPISPWPLAIGWWICIACGMVLLGGAIWFFKNRLNYLRSWKRDTFKKLDSLERNLSPSTSGETIAFLSEYLRRIAVRRFPRKECAGLVGDAWLKWLKAHDPKQFDWAEKGKLLIEIPYAPVHTELPSQQIKELIQAVRHWVC